MTNTQSIDASSICKDCPTIQREGIHVMLLEYSGLAGVLFEREDDRVEVRVRSLTFVEKSGIVEDSATG